MSATTTTVEILMLGVDEIRPNPLNPRGPVEADPDLVASIRAQGVLQPLTVTPDGLIVIGHRRHAAARAAGLVEVPCVVRDFTETEQLEVMIVENLQREDLSPLAEARAYERLLAGGGSRSNVARRLGVAPARITERMQLLGLEPAVAAMVDRGELPLKAVAPLAKCDPVDQARYAGLIVRRQLRAADLADAVAADAPAPAPRVRQGTRGTAKREIKREVKAIGKEDTPRAAAVELVKTHEKRIVSFRAIADVLEVTCCECGLKGSPELCLQCPLPKFVKAVVRESENVRRS